MCAVIFIIQVALRQISPATAWTQRAILSRWGVVTDDNVESYSMPESQLRLRSRNRTPFNSAPSSARERRDVKPHQRRDACSKRPVEHGVVRDPRNVPTKCKRGRKPHHAGRDRSGHDCASNALRAWCRSDRVHPAPRGWFRTQATTAPSSTRTSTMLRS